MSVGAAVVAFVLGAAVSLGTSWVLVSRLERIGARLGLTEGLLGVVAALAADAPEITASVTTLVRHQRAIGSGVTIGSNVFNLAALLGLSAVVAGRVSLHRKVVALGGSVAVAIALVTLLAVTGVVSAVVGLVLVLVVLVPSIAVLGVPSSALARSRLPRTWVRWLREAVAEEERELTQAIHPAPGRLADAVVAVGALTIVVAASIAMERGAATLGVRYGVADIVVGGLVLAAVTSLPNAVAAVYLARRGRGAAMLSTALNSNAINVTAGLLIPATVVGLSHPSASGTLVAGWYLGLAALTVALAYWSRSLGRRAGWTIVAGYVVFVIVLPLVAT